MPFGWRVWRVKAPRTVVRCRSYRKTRPLAGSSKRSNSTPIERAPGEAMRRRHASSPEGSDSHSPESSVESAVGITAP